MEEPKSAIVCLAVGEDAMESVSAGSIVLACAKCECAVWLSVNGQEFKQENPDMDLLCEDCAMLYAELHDVEDVQSVPGGLEAVSESTGIPVQEIKEAMLRVYGGKKEN